MDLVGRGLAAFRADRASKAPNHTRW